jgi:hypothetical protein
MDNAKRNLSPVVFCRKIRIPGGLPEIVNLHFPTWAGTWLQCDAVAAWLLCVEPTSPLFVWRGVAVAAKPPWYGADCGSQPAVLGTWRPVYHI